MVKPSFLLLAWINQSYLSQTVTGGVGNITVVRSERRAPLLLELKRCQITQFFMLFQSLCLTSLSWSSATTSSQVRCFLHFLPPTLSKLSNQETSCHIKQHRRLFKMFYFKRSETNRRLLKSNSFKICNIYTPPDRLTTMQFRNKNGRHPHVDRH